MLPSLYKRQNYGRILSILATYASGASPGPIHSAADKGQEPVHDCGSDSQEEAAERIKKSTPVGRHGRHEELANLAAYLYSNFADYIDR